MNVSACALVVTVVSLHAPPADDVTRLQQQLTQTAADLPALVRISDLQLHMGHTAEALESAERALQWNPGEAYATGARGLALAALQREGAEAALDDALATHPVHPGWLAARAELREARGAWDGALEDRETLVRVGPTPDAFLARARVQSRLGRHAAAAQGLEEGAAALKQPSVLVREAALEHARAHDCTRALKVLDGRDDLPELQLWKADLEDAREHRPAARKIRTALVKTLDARLKQRDQPALRAWKAAAQWKLGDHAGARKEAVNLEKWAASVGAVQALQGLMDGHAEAFTCER